MVTFDVNGLAEFDCIGVEFKGKWIVLNYLYKGVLIDEVEVYIPLIDLVNLRQDLEDELPFNSSIAEEIIEHINSIL